MRLTLEQILAARAESDDVDFKIEFDPAAQRDWCELLKDIVAIGNHGGGGIVIGVGDDGVTVGAGKVPLARLDAAAVGDQIRRHTGRHEPRCIVHSAMRDGAEVVVIEVLPTEVPVIFSRNGTYEHAGKQKSAFVEGKVYFRHNSKSEPGSTEDLEGAIRREVERHREEWLGKVRQVIEAPLGSTISVVTREDGEQPTGNPVSVRLVNKPDAMEVPKWDPDRTHPYRQKELVMEVNRALNGARTVTSHDIQCMRRAHGIDSNPNFSHKTRFSPRQYSPALVEWLIEEVGRDREFFGKCKELLKRSPSEVRQAQ